LSFWVAETFAVETEADGSPWGFWSVITSSLRSGEKRGTSLGNGENILLETLVIDEVNATLNTIR
jgi:hypothetical protein